MASLQKQHVNEAAIAMNIIITHFFILTDWCKYKTLFLIKIVKQYLIYCIDHTYFCQKILIFVHNFYLVDLYTI